MFSFQIKDYKRYQKTYLFFIFLVTFFISTAFASEPIKEKLEKVKQLYEQGDFETIYSEYLKDIPEIETHDELTEDLFYYFAMTCMQLEYFDEAEGYLYAIPYETGQIYFPEKYDRFWAELKDRMGETDQAYERYDKFVKTYPQSGYLPEVLYRLGRMTYQLGNFEVGKEYFRKLIHQFPDTEEAKRLLESDDLKLDYYFLIFDRFYDQEEAQAKIEELKTFQVEAFIHRTNQFGVIVYLVGAGLFNEWKEAEENREELEEMGFLTEVYP